MQENEKLILTLVIVFSISLLALGIFFFLLINIFYKKLKNRQKEALDNLVLGQMNERERMARDLHDGLLPDLSNILLTLDNMESEDSVLTGLKEKSKVELNDAIIHLRQISHNLMSVSLRRYGLAEAMQDMLDDHKNDIRTVFNSNCLGVKFNDSIKSHVFYIFQEFYYNSKKHSKALNIRITLKLHKNELSLEYMDDGIGFNENGSVNGGIGLKNIATRARMMNADLKMRGSNGFNAVLKVMID